MKVPKENHQQERSNLLPIAHLGLYVCDGEGEDVHTCHVAVYLENVSTGTARGERLRLCVVLEEVSCLDHDALCRGPSCGASVHMEVAT